MFDPPHIGHLILAQEALWQLRLDEVRLVTCARPPHRAAPALPVEVRLAMVEAAVAGVRGLVASRVEADRPGPSYTVDTLQGFADAEPEVALWLIVGADQLATFGRWREPERIQRLARLAVVAREGVPEGPLPAPVDPCRCDHLDMPTIGVSSTLVRERIAAGEPVEHLLPAGVAGVLSSVGLPVRGAALP
jgi:nicotinate-nucleotide adenylyltransferase